MSLRHQISPLFPYTTLFRSDTPGQDRYLNLWRTSISLMYTGFLNNLRFFFECQSHARFHLLICEDRSEEHTSELQSLTNLVCRLLLEKKKYGSPTLFSFDGI